jgi:hypothetical protein
MQASLFRLPEEEAMMRETSAPAKRTVFLIQKSMQRKHGRGLDFDSVWAESREARAVRPITRGICHLICVA